MVYIYFILVYSMCKPISIGWLHILSNISQYQHPNLNLKEMAANWHSPVLVDSIFNFYFQLQFLISISIFKSHLPFQYEFQFSILFPSQISISNFRKFKIEVKRS